MAKCKKCGTELDKKTGYCPKCYPTQVRFNPNARFQTETQMNQPPVKLTGKQKRAAKKAEKKRLKKEKIKAMPIGKRIKRIAVRVLAIVLALVIVVCSCSCALVYFDLASIPLAEKFMSLFGYGKNQETERSNFAFVPGKFTEERITNENEAIKAAQNAASQLGLQNATDELSLLHENNVDDLNYYRLQQNYEGIPVYGKTIVVVADDSGEAKSITSNALDISYVNTNVNYNSIDFSDSVRKFLKENGFDGASDIEVEDISDDDLTIYFYDDSKQVLACSLNVSFEYDSGSASVPLLYDLNNEEVIFQICTVNTESAVCYGPTKSTDSFNGVLLDDEYYLADTDRNIYVFDANNKAYYRYNSFGGYYYLDDNTIPQYVKSTNNLFGDTKSETSHENGYDLLKGMSYSYDYFSDFNLHGYDTYTCVYNDSLGGNGDNALGGYDYIEDAIALDYPDYTGSKSAKTGVVIMGTAYSENIEKQYNILWHEYTHTITRNVIDWVDNDIDGNNQSGAINEGYSDLFGELIEADYYGREPDWTNDFRPIKNPTSKGYPVKLSSSDNGGEDYTHGHSTVLTYAAYLMHTKSYDGKTLSIEDLERLYIHTMNILPSDCTFAILGEYLKISAESLGFSDDKIKCIESALEETEIISDSNEISYSYNTKSQVKVYDKNGLAYDDYTIEIDGEEFNGLMKWGVFKKEYHKEIEVDSSSPEEIKLPVGDYSIAVIDNYTGNKSYTINIEVRENSTNDEIIFETAFGFDYTVSEYPDLTVKDVNNSVYGDYNVSITGKSETGSYKNKFDVTECETQKLQLNSGKYGLTITDNADSKKTKTYRVKVDENAPADNIIISTNFGKRYGEFDISDVPEGAYEYNGHYYYVYDYANITDWYSAKEFCEEKNGYLATFTSKEENDFVYSILDDFGKKSAYFGLYDDGYNDWKWINGENFSYSNWADGEPNSYSERYGMFYDGYTETWNDGDFGNYTSEDVAFICEWGEYSINVEGDTYTPQKRQTSGERDIVLCLDMSGSMDGDKLEQTKQASVKFIQTVLEEDASIALVTYESSASVVCDFTTDEQALIDIVNNIYAGGGTNIDDGLQKSVNLLTYSNAKKKIIVLMSDGAPNEDRCGDDLISYAEEIKNQDVIIYTLGFFGGYSGNSEEQILMEKIASEGRHYEVDDADSLVFFFGDMADEISGQEYIYIRIACPVNVKVSFDGETLNSDEDDLSTRTSFGTLTFEENTEEYSEDEDADDRVKILRLKAEDDYDIEIEGTGKGRMDYTIGFMDENGDYSDFRKFKDIKINKKTEIATVATKSKTTVLKVDEDGDGEYDITYKAGENETGKVVDYSYIYYIVGGVVGLIVILILYLIIKKKVKKLKIKKQERKAIELQRKAYEEKINKNKINDKPTPPVTPVRPVNGGTVKQPVNKKFCTGCGTPLKDGAQFCTKCGKHVK